MWASRSRLLARRPLFRGLASGPPPRSSPSTLGLVAAGVAAGSVGAAVLQKSGLLRENLEWSGLTELPNALFTTTAHADRWDNRPPPPPPPGRPPPKRRPDPAPMDKTTVVGYLTAGVAVAGLALFGYMLTRYKRCPPNMLLVVYGRTLTGGVHKRTHHGGGAFIWPIIQDFNFLHLEPIPLEIKLHGALSLEKIRIDCPSVFTVAVGTRTETMENATVRLLHMDLDGISHQANEIIMGQLRQVVATLSIEQINRDREKFVEEIRRHCGAELNKVGLELLNVNITNIEDHSGVIEAMGQKAASEAVQQAAIDVAEKEKIGKIGVTKNMREQDIQVSIFEKERIVEMKQQEQLQRVEVADLTTKEIQGTNHASALQAESQAALQVKQAAAYQEGESRKKEAEQGVIEAEATAAARAQAAIATKVEQEQRAMLEAPAKAAKAKTIVEAEAAARKAEIEAKGEADAVFLRMEAQARGEYEILARKAEGLGMLVDKCGSSQQAFQLLMLEHLDHLADASATAVSNIKFDKVVVWDGGNNGGDGNATSNFIRNVAKSLPPAADVLKEVAGVEIPKYFGALPKHDDVPSGGELPKKPAVEP